MPKDFLAGAKERYDVVVIGSGLAGMTAANVLGRAGRSVLLVEQHYKLGGMATWFKRPGGPMLSSSVLPKIAFVDQNAEQRVHNCVQ